MSRTSSAAATIPAGIGTGTTDPGTASTVLSVIVIVLVIGIIALCVLAAIMGWRRWRILATPGTFPAQLVVPGRPGSVGVAVSYNETSVEILTLVSLSPLPRVSIPRHRLEMERFPGSESDRVLGILSDRSDPAETVEIEMSPLHCAELTTWIESGPQIGIGHWREAPERRQRRKFF